MQIENWGQTDYFEAQKKQLEYVSALYQKESPEKIIFCSHPPIVTLGKKSETDDLQGWSGETIKVKRGGRATYHGPGQVVVYPIINLKKRDSDIHRFLRGLERSMINTLKEFNLPAHAKENHTGVWVGEKKIASIGVAITRWITYHGLAINLYKDSQAFSGIKPCGLDNTLMTSVEENLNRQIERSSFEKILESFLLQELCE